MLTIEEFEKYKDIIIDLIKVYIELNKSLEIKKDTINYTLREISLFIQALKNKIINKVHII